VTLRGLGRADSITVDPHKGLFLPYGTGALLVKDPSALRRAHGSHAEYLPPMQEDADFVDFCELSASPTSPRRSPSCPEGQAPRNTGARRSRIARTASRWSAVFWTMP